jgi:hypothetical protein
LYWRNRLHASAYLITSAASSPDLPGNCLPREMRCRCISPGSWRWSLPELFSTAARFAAPN